MSHAACWKWSSVAQSEKKEEIKPQCFGLEFARMPVYRTEKNFWLELAKHKLMVWGCVFLVYFTVLICMFGVFLLSLCFS